MHLLLYLLAVSGVLVGVAWGLFTDNLLFLGNGILVGLIFGTMGKGLHLLVQIEQHLRLARHGDAPEIEPAPRAPKDA